MANLLSFDARTDSNGDIELSVQVPNVTMERGIPVNCGMVQVMALNLSKEEAVDLIQTLHIELEA